MDEPRFFDSLEMFLSHCAEPTAPAVQSLVPLSSVAIENIAQRRQKLIVCHDYAGAYHAEDSVHGSASSAGYDLYGAFRFSSHFIYFSHHLVSPPPVAVTELCHTHGALSLGTVITEWQDGAVLMHKLLDDANTLSDFVGKLVELAVARQFDGYLINIENPIAPKHVNTLIEFVEMLSVALKSVVAHAVVFWYDSVTVSGQLQWQNQLNDENWPFFAACDGIFLNYHWKEDYPLLSTQRAGERAGDVFFGVDVFGRKTFGGGGFDTHVAVRAASAAGASTAIFAPGWVYENHARAEAGGAARLFWSSLEDILPRCQLTQLPFWSCFSDGKGEQLHFQGEICHSAPFHHMRLQSPTLSRCEDTSVVATNKARVSLQRATDHALHLGSSLCFAGQLDDAADSFALAELYDFDVPLAAGQRLFVAVSVRGADGSFAHPAISLVNDNDGRDECVLFGAVHDAVVTAATRCLDVAVRVAADCARDARPNGWTRHTFHTTLDGAARVRRLQVLLTGAGSCSVHIGEVALWTDAAPPLPIVSNVHRLNDTDVAWSCDGACPLFVLTMTDGTRQLSRCGTYRCTKGSVVASVAALSPTGELGVPTEIH